MAGKGDKWRKTDFKKFFNNFDQIKFNPNKKNKKNEKKKSGRSSS
jgi:hypothetical protein